MNYRKRLRRWAATLLVISSCIYTHIALADFQCDTVTEIPAAECQALVSLYNNTGGTAWNDSSDWLISNTPCSWYGITCENGHVTRLSIYGNNLVGSLPADLSSLTNLQTLWLSSNQLSGNIVSFRPMGLISASKSSSDGKRGYE